MNKIFDMTNGFWSVVGKIVDVFVLHLIWLICCIPIVTFGPATTALYYSLMKDVKDENTHYIKSFFKSFKMNFKQGAFLGIGVLAVFGMLCFALYYYTMLGTKEWNIIKMITIGMLILFLFVAEYIFPLLSKFDNKTIKLVETALFMSVRHIGWTLLMSVVTIGVYAIVIYFEFLPLLLLGYGLAAFINSYILNYIFERYIPKEDDEADENTIEEDSAQLMSWKTPVISGEAKDEDKDNMEGDKKDV